MEPTDVSDGEYDAYDSDGYVLSLSVADGRVHVSTTGGRHYDQALERLRAVMVHSPVTIESSTLSEMIRQLLNLERKASKSRFKGSARKQSYG